MDWHYNSQQSRFALDLESGLLSRSMGDIGVGVQKLTPGKFQAQRQQVRLRPSFFACLLITPVFPMKELGTRAAKALASTSPLFCLFQSKFHNEPGFLISFFPRELLQKLQHGDDFHLSIFQNSHIFFIFQFWNILEMLNFIPRISPGLPHPV